MNESNTFSDAELSGVSGGTAEGTWILQLAVSHPSHPDSVVTSTGFPTYEAAEKRKLELVSEYKGRGYTIKWTKIDKA